MLLSGYGWPQGQQKTHSRCQPWVLVKSVSTSTRAAGVVGYDDYQSYLSNQCEHCSRRIARPKPPSSASFSEFVLKPDPNFHLNLQGERLATEGRDQD
jgi:hypothetical protein